MFTDLERPKELMLERERQLDRLSEELDYERADSPYDHF
jgi:hypothetical protein